MEVKISRKIKKPLKSLFSSDFMNDHLINKRLVKVVLDVLRALWQIMKVSKDMHLIGGRSNLLSHSAWVLRDEGLFISGDSERNDHFRLQVCQIAQKRLFWLDIVTINLH